MDPLKIANLLIFVVILTGFVHRRRPKLHVKLMATAFAADVAMVLYIELTRHAIGTAMGRPHPYVLAHIAISVVVMALYVHQLISGVMMLRGGRIFRNHRVVGVTFLIFRFLNLATSFWIDRFL